MAFELGLLGALFLISLIAHWFFIKKIPKLALALMGILVSIALVAIGLTYVGIPGIENFLESNLRLVSIPITLGAGAILGTVLGRFI